ncbi:hypothetical protein [Saccharothrix syringae]|uniref:Uncharacterized protein n=1 Tax=Saccharothrix syringae TaxID=103733 RepID=A0A5Q0HB04_SACSY|nr:hypothetical protein [Saccharothrix syringae]QFZ23144.1 hypothetical protein EKG83_42005 [Saccharothrix syringae]
MNDTEKLLTEALRLRAERTPPPGPVLAALHRPRRTRKPLLLVLATAATAAAVVVTVTTVARPAAEPAPPAASIPTTAVDPGPAVPTVPLEYRPSWVPDGFVEWQRSYASYGSERHYHRPGADEPLAAQIGFSVRTGDTAQLAATMAGAAPEDRTTILGAPGFYAGDQLYWQVREDRFLSVTTQGVPDARTVARRFAEHVEPDDRRVRVPLSFAGSTAFTTSELGDPGWSTRVDAEHRGRRYIVALTTMTPAKTGEREVTARGRTAWYTETPAGSLSVPMGPGLRLTVSGWDADRGPASAGELVEVADLVVVDPEPQARW